ncbi:hypothetical protein Hte_003180 [Hypoxylon texense]
MCQCDICENWRRLMHGTTPSDQQSNGLGESDIQGPSPPPSPEFRVPSPSGWDSMREEPTRYAAPLKRTEEATSPTRPGQPLEFGSDTKAPIKLWPPPQDPSRPPRVPAWARDAQIETPPQRQQQSPSLELDGLERSSPAEAVEDKILYSTFHTPREMTVLNSAFTPPPETPLMDSVFMQPPQMPLLNSAFTTVDDSAQSAPPPTRGKVLRISDLLN